MLGARCHLGGQGLEARQGCTQQVGAHMQLDKLYCCTLQLETLLAWPPCLPSSCSALPVMHMGGRVLGIRHDVYHLICLSSSSSAVYLIPKTLSPMHACSGDLQNPILNPTYNIKLLPNPDPRTQETRCDPRIPETWCDSVDMPPTCMCTCRPGTQMQM